MANVSKGAAIVTSRSRSLRLSGQTSDRETDRGSDRDRRSDRDRGSDRYRGSDQWFTIFSRWNANVCRFDFSGLDLFSHDQPSGEPILGSDLQG